MFQIHVICYVVFLYLHQPSKTYLPQLQKSSHPTAASFNIFAHQLFQEQLRCSDHIDKDCPFPIVQLHCVTCHLGTHLACQATNRASPLEKS